MSFNACSFRGEKDLQRVIVLRWACTTLENLNDYPTVSDLRELLDPLSSEAQVQTRLWEDTHGNLVAFGIVHTTYNNLYFQVHPQWRDDDIETQIIAWAADLLRKYGQDQGKRVTLDANCRENDTERITVLERHGFTRQQEQTLRMTRSLNGPIRAPLFPEGFTLRQVEGEHEVEEYVAMHRDAFGTNNMTVEHRLSIIRNPDYRPELDLVAIAPGGGFAAFCVCNIHREENERSGQKEGEIGVIGTRRAFRGMGLGRAVLLAGLQSLQTQGLDMATLGTTSSNVHAIRLYETVGFRIETRTLWYSMEL